MKALQTVVTFLAALLVLALIAALATGGALRNPEADVLRLAVWSGIVVASGLLAWWRWKALGRRGRAKNAREAEEQAFAAAAPAPGLHGDPDASQTSSLDRLSRIAERGRVAATAAPSLATPPVDMDAPAPESRSDPETDPESEPFDTSPAPTDFLPQEPVPPFETLSPPPVDDVAAPFSAEGSAPTPDSMMPPEPPGSEDLAAPAEPLTPKTIQFAEGLPQPTKSGRRSSSLGLTPMGAGDGDEEGGEEEGPVFGEEEDEEQAASNYQSDEELEEGEEDEEGELPTALAAASGEALASESGHRTAVLFRQIFPPRHDGALSYFGGLPIASPDFAWPRAEAGVPYSFLMQVDCAEVPKRARMGLPDSGLLYVFMDLTWGQQDAFRVIHVDSEGELTEIAAPDDLPPTFGEEGKHIWKWPREVEHVPRLLPKWPFQPIAIDISADAWDELDAEEEGEAGLLWPNGSRIGELLADAQGEEIGSDWFTIADFVGDGGALIRPFANFPHDARAIQIFAGLLLDRIESGRVQTKSPEYDSLSEEDRAALLERIAAEAREWYADAAFEAPFTEVPQEFADQFWGWLSGFPWLARFVMTEAVTLSIEGSLAGGSEAAARVPAEVARRVHHRHALAVHTDSGLHANTPDRMLAPPVDVQGHQIERARTHLLLLEISSNEGLGHHFGEGVCQFWILPEDLQARRFDKVELTADAY